jgi:LytTr DNA-binding domain
MSRKLILTLLVFVGLPIFVGIVLGGNQTRAGAQLPWLFSILYWVALSVSTWWLMAAATWLLDQLLRPWSPPVWLVWILGGVAGSFVARPVIYQFASLFKQWMNDGQLRAMPPVEFSVQFGIYYITNWSVVLIMWVAAQGVYNYLQAWAAPDAVTVAVAPSELTPSDDSVLGSVSINEPTFVGFLERLPPFLGRDVIALHSEDHYLRVYTRRGDGLVLVTISEAMRTLEALGFVGLQVHRSWWLCINAVKQVQSRDRKTYALLENGIQVPVSQTYRALFDKTFSTMQSEN